MTVSMWNTALGWNGLNKRESLMTLITKVNLIQIGPFQGFQNLRVGSGYKECYVGFREMRLGKRAWKRLKTAKIIENMTRHFLYDVENM